MNKAEILFTNRANERPHEGTLYGSLLLVLFMVSFYCECGGKFGLLLKILLFWYLCIQKWSEHQSTKSIRTYLVDFMM